MGFQLAWPPAQNRHTLPFVVTRSFKCRPLQKEDTDSTTRGGAEREKERERERAKTKTKTSHDGVRTCDVLIWSPRERERESERERDGERERQRAIEI
jgi:hypothetical protein